MTENDKERQRTTASPSDKPAIISLSKHNCQTTRNIKERGARPDWSTNATKKQKKQLSKAMQAIISHMKMSFETWPSLHKLKVAVPAFHLFTLQGSNNIIRATSFHSGWLPSAKQFKHAPCLCTLKCCAYLVMRPLCLGKQPRCTKRFVSERQTPLVLAPLKMASIHTMGRYLAGWQMDVAGCGRPVCPDKARCRDLLI